MVNLPTGSSDLILILGCMASNLLVRELFSLCILVLYGELLPSSFLVKPPPPPPFRALWISLPQWSLLSPSSGAGEGLYRGFTVCMYSTPCIVLYILVYTLFTPIYTILQLQWQLVYTLALLRHARKVLPKSPCITLYNTMVLPLFD